MHTKKDDGKAIKRLAFPANGVLGFFRKLKKLATDDPRRIVHSLKVGLAITLVSTFYYVTPLFKGFGDTSMWSVVTVVLVMEFTVGSTLTKGLNRAFATLLASSLGIAAHQLAVLCGDKGEPFALGVIVFLIATIATFARFLPELKAKYDYGVMIFILTFCFVVVSSYRKEKLVVLAYQRITTIGIGVFVALFTSILVFPVWAGEDLHKLMARNLNKLSEFMEGLETELSRDTIEIEGAEDKPSLQVHKIVLSCKSTEDNLNAFARWEPGHGRFGFAHPWKQYVKIGNLSRQCAYYMEVLSAYITKSHIKIPSDHSEIRTACLELASNSSKALAELASSFRSMTTMPAAFHEHMDAASRAADALQSSLEVGGDGVVSATTGAATVVSLLVEIMGCVRQTVAAVEELATLAKFEVCEEDLTKASVKRVMDVEGYHVAIAVKDLGAALE